MKISQLALKSVAGLPDLSIDLMSNAGRPHDLVLVAGPAASGKTRLLELVLAGLETIGPYEGIVRSADWVTSPQKSARLELGVWLAETERENLSLPSNPARCVVGFGPDGIICDAPKAISRLLSRYDHDPKSGKREYFHETRQRAWGGRMDGIGALEQSLWRCSKDPQKYGFIPSFLATLPTDAERHRVFAAGLERLSATVRYTPDAAAPSPSFGVVDRNACFSNGSPTRVRLAELSSSEANAVLIASTAAMTGLSHSIVLLDRPELHVADDHLVAWVQALAGLGHDNQWIIATGNERLLAAVDASQVVSLSRGGSA